MVIEKLQRLLEERIIEAFTAGMSVIEIIRAMGRTRLVPCIPYYARLATFAARPRMSISAHTKSIFGWTRFLLREDIPLYAGALDGSLIRLRLQLP